MGFFKESKGNYIMRTKKKSLFLNKWNWFDYLNAFGMILLCFIMIYPFWYVLVLSLNEGKDALSGGIYFWPRKFTLENFIVVLKNSNLQHAYFITTSRAVLGSLLQLVVTSLAAFAISKRHLRGRITILFYFMMPMFIGGTVVSYYVIIAKLGLINNFLVYIIPGSFNFFMMIVMRTFIDGLPSSIQESAKIDGANNFTIYTRIILPLSKPIVVTILLFAAVFYWLDFSANLLYVTKKELMTTQYLMYLVVRANQINTVLNDSQMGNVDMFNKQAATSESIKMATLMIVTLPILFVYPFAQKHFVKGLTLGSIKG